MIYAGVLMLNIDTVLCVDFRSFDNSKPDLGLHDYIAQVGFVPNQICFLNFHVMFLWSFKTIDDTYLDPICTGQNGAPCTQRWTLNQFKRLVDLAHEEGICVFLGILANTISPVWKNTDYIWPYPEVIQKTRGDKYLWGNSVNILKRFSDGRLFEDEFINRLLNVLTSFGFDGYTAGDGMLGLRGPRETLADTDYSEDMIDQFEAWSGLKAEKNGSYDERADYIQHYMQKEWIEFWVNRWTSHVRKVSVALKQCGKHFHAIDAWSRNPADARRCFGIDYKALYESGLEALYVQARESNKWRKHREGEYVREQNNVFTFLTHKAYEPRLKYYWAQATVNICEFWNTIQDLPHLTQRECISYLFTHFWDGSNWKGIAEGLCIIWANDLSGADWAWLNSLWNSASTLRDGFSAPLGLTLIFDDSDIFNLCDEAKLFAMLSDSGVVISTSVRSCDAACCPARAFVTFSPKKNLAELESEKNIFTVSESGITFRSINYSFAEGISLMKKYCGVKSTTGRIFGFENKDGEYVISLENPDNLFYEKVYFAIDRTIKCIEVLPPHQWYSMPHSSQGGSAAISVPPDSSVQFVVRTDGDSIPLAFNFKDLGV